MVNEKDILRKISEGDHDAFKTLFQSYYSKISNFCFSILKDHESAEDITQIIFIKVWEKRELFADIKYLDSYLYRMSRNMVLNYISVQQLSTLELDKSNAVAYETSDSKILGDEIRLLMDMIVDQMPKQRKKIMIMSRYEGMSNAEIAEKLGLKKKTVENHINLALKELRKYLPMLLLLIMQLGTNPLY